MKIQPSISATVLVYTLILVSITLIMWVVILNSAVILGANYEYVNTRDKLTRFISDNSRIVFKLAKQLNSNWSWFLDQISCPTSVTLSGATISKIINTSLSISEEWVFCLGWSWSWKLKIYFNRDFDDLVIAEYGSWRVNLISSWIWKKGVFDFSDPDNTLIDFSSTDIYKSDNIDDDGNSDNYSISSTWVILYWSWIVDDDALHRSLKVWYIPPRSWFNSVFWNTTYTSNVIDENVNNWDWLLLKIWGLSSGVIHLDSDKEFSIYVYQFDKQSYETFNELTVLDKKIWLNIEPWVWYIQLNPTGLSISQNVTWNEYLFDFTTYDYAVMVENITKEVLSYRLKLESETWSWVYIVPIDDSDEVVLKYYWNVIIIDEEFRLVHDKKMIIWSK